MSASAKRLAAGSRFGRRAVASLAGVALVASTGCADGSDATGPAGGVSFSVSVTLPEANAQDLAGIAGAFDAADEVFVFVGAFPDGLDTARILDDIEERAVRNADDLLEELARISQVLRAGWVPIGADRRVRLSLIGPEGDLPVVAIALVARERRVLFAGASRPVRLRVAPPPQVTIPLTPLAWDTEAVPGVVSLVGPGSLADLDARGTFYTGDPLGLLPPDATVWTSLDGRVEVVDERAGIVRALVAGTARVEVENVLHGFSLADDGGPENGQIADTVLLQIGGR